jgi:hypothetical protein
MKFVKYNDNKSVTIPPAVLTVCGLEDEGKLEMAGAKGAVILSKSEMTAMEMVRTILALTDRAGQLMRLHRGALHLPRRGHRGADPPRRHRSRLGQSGSGHRARRQAGLPCGRGLRRDHRVRDILRPRPLRYSRRAAGGPAQVRLLPVRTGGYADGRRCHLR